WSCAWSFDNSEFSRRRPVEVRDGQFLQIKSPEDTILRKLVWYQLGGGVSDRQWRDIQGVLRARRGMLDEGYLFEWAADLRVTGLLQRAMSEQ
ncbi:MAG: hypothetical protein RJA70_3379, partial [Pseudomonadota bacterium]